MARNERHIAALVLVAVIALAIGATFAIADPLAPTTLTQTTSSARNISALPAQSVEARGGNVTEVNINALTQTRVWQGYYGNIAGEITLDNANNFTFYNWTAAEPRGQIYATLNTSIAWTGVTCFNFSNDSAAFHLTIENYYGITAPDVDGVNETYTATNHPAFQVGARTMSDCPTTYIFRDDAAQTADFINVLLFDPTLNDTGWIYTTVIENRSTATGSPQDLTCYNGQDCDFQILVNEDGHGTNTLTTTWGTGAPYTWAASDWIAIGGEYEAA